MHIQIRIILWCRENHYHLQNGRVLAHNGFSWSCEIYNKKCDYDFIHLCTFPNKEHHTGIQCMQKTHVSLNLYTFPDASVSWLDSQCLGDMSPPHFRAQKTHVSLNLYTFPDASVSWLDSQSQCLGDMSPALFRALWLHPVTGLNFGKPKYISTIHITLTCFTLVLEFFNLPFLSDSFSLFFYQCRRLFFSLMLLHLLYILKTCQNFTSWFYLFGRKTTWWILLMVVAQGRGCGANIDTSK